MQEQKKKGRNNNKVNMMIKDGNSIEKNRSPNIKNRGLNVTFEEITQKKTRTGTAKRK